MATKEVQVKITAVDQASPVLKNIGATATNTANQIEAGNKRASQSYEEVQKRAQAFGAGLGAVIGGVSLAGRSYVEQENQIRALDRAYGDASKTMQQFADDLQKTTTFSDDAARKSEITAATLARNYGFTAAEIKKVVQVSADLAAVTGFDLADATQRVTAALRGEAESAEALGLTMNQQAIDRNNLTLTMSNEEAAHFRLNALLDQSTFAYGAAADAADTNAGKAKQWVNALQDQVQALGDASGAMGQYLAVLGNLGLALPLVGGMLGKIGTGLGSLGLGAGAIGPGLIVGGAASLAYGYGQDTLGTTKTNEFWNNFFLQGSAVLNALLPGNPADLQKYTDQMATNRSWDAINAVLQTPGRSQADTVQALASLLGVQGTTQTVDAGYWYDSKGRINYGAPPPGVSTSTTMYVPPSDSDVLAAAQRAAANRGMDLDAYLRYIAPSKGLIVDPVTGQAITPMQYGSSYQSRIGAQYGYTGAGTMGFGAIAPGTYDPYRFWAGGNAEMGTGREATMAYYRAGGGGVANDLYLQGPVRYSDAQMETLRDAQGKARLGEQYAGYADLLSGAGGGRSAFQTTQNIIMDRETMYGGQASEFTQNQQALTDARDILLERQQEGIKLSKEEQALLDNYPGLYERVTGGIEDATVAQGLQAAAYIENMKIGDQMNQALAGQTDATESLNTSIERLTLLLNDVPPDVKTEILLDLSDESVSDLIAYYNYLSSIPGYVATTIETHYAVTGTGGEVRFRGAMNGVTAMANGGTAYDPAMPRFANGGTYALVGEVGPELVKLSRGDQVTPTGASRSLMGGRGRGDTFHFNAPLTVVASDPRQFKNAVREEAIGGARI